MEMNISSPLQQINSRALNTQSILLLKRIYLWLMCLFSLLFTGSAFAQPLVATDPVFYVDVYEQAMAINIREENLFTGGIPPVYITDIQVIDAPSSYSNPYYTNSPTCLYYEWTENDDYEPVVIDVSLVDGHGNTVISTVTLEEDMYILIKPSGPSVSNKVSASEAPIFQAYSANDLIQPVCQLDQLNSDPQTNPLFAEIFQNSTFDFDPVLDMFATDPNDPTGAGLMLHDSACGALTEPQNGMIVRNGNQISYTPDTDFIGTDNYEYCVTDQSYHPMGDDYLPGTIGTVEITVVPDGPPDLSDDSVTTETNTPVIIDVLMNDSNGDLFELFTTGESDFGAGIELFTGPESCPESTTYNSGCIRYTPPTEGYETTPFEGVDTFTYTAGYPEDIENASTATVTITVVPPEGAPEAVDDNTEANAGEPVVIQVLSNDTGSNLSVFSLTEPGHGTAVITPQVEGYDVITYTPDPSFQGTDTFQYTITDGDNNTSNSTATVTIEVAPVAPGLTDDNATTETNTSVIIDVLMNDTNGEFFELFTTGESDFGAVIELFTGPESCPEATTYNSGCIRYTPPTEGYENSPFEGMDTFTYTAGYPGNTNNASTATVTITVVPREGAPLAIDDDAEATAGDSVDINVLANDLGSNLSVFSLTEPEHGTAVIKQQPGGEDVITYTPDESYEGSDTFQYTITDGDINTKNSTATVRIEIATTSITLKEIAEKVAPGEVPVATAIDMICPMLEDFQSESESSGLTEGQQKLLTRCSALIETAQAGDFSQIRDALGYISGEEIFSQGDLSVRILNTQLKNIGNRIAALRGGARGVSINGLGVVVLGEEEVNRFLSLAPSMLGGGAAADEPEDALLADSRLSLFVNGTLNFGDTDPEKYQDGFNFDTLGITLGADYRLKDNLIIGGAIGFSDSEVDFNRNHGDMDSDSMTLTTYGTYFTEKFYVDTLLGTGNVNFDTRRNLDFSDIMGGVKTTALSNTDGDQTLFSINMGYNFQKANWVISPYVGYDYLDSKLGAFIEKEGLGYGQGWELEFANQNVKSSLLITGLSFSFNKSFGFGVIVPHLRIAYKKELEDNVRTLDMQFVNDPSNTVFTISSDEADTGFINIATGLSFVTGSGFSGFVDYDVITAYSNLSSTTLTAGLRFERRF